MIYRKPPTISPGLIYFRKRFLMGLYIQGWAYIRVGLYRVYQKKGNRTTGCIKKKVIELKFDYLFFDTPCISPPVYTPTLVSELLCVWTRFFHIRKDHAFSCWMISSSCQMDKKWADTNPIKNVSQNRIFSPLRVGSKTIENEPPLVLKLMNFTSLNDAHIYNYY
jgi:hypothetical protein